MHKQTIRHGKGLLSNVTVFVIIFFFLFRLGEMPNLIHDSDDNLALVVFAEAVLRVFCWLTLHLLSIASFSCSSNS